MLLQTDNLTKDYGRVRALDSLTLCVGPGEIFGLLGPNGSGKSTALRVLLGFLRPTSGTAAIAGHDCWRDSVAARQHVSYLPGELRLYENMTGQRLLRFLGNLRGGLDAVEVHKLARALDIDLSRPISQLSSGMKRKVALLLVLAPRTPLVLLDEPTNTLDPTMRDQLLELLCAARDQGRAVLFSSHVLSEVERVCDRVGILQRGRLVHFQEISALRESRLVKARLPQPMQHLPPLPGAGRQRCVGQDLTVEHTGPLAPLLEWLAAQQVVDLTITPLGLGPIYHRYHGNEA
jgi:ABC-2 type transport system ATP-binding protein